MIDNIFSWTTKNTYLFTACVKTVIDKNSVYKKRSGSHPQEKLSTTAGLMCVDCRVLKESGFLSITVMVSPQQNELHTLPKGNPDNIHKADSTEKCCHEKQIPASLFTFFY